MCNTKSETISHIVSECEILAQKEYKRRHDIVVRIVHWKSCGKYNLKRSENSMKMFQKVLLKIKNVMIQCDKEIKARKPDIIGVSKNERSCAIIDIAIPRGIRVNEK